MHFWQGEKNCTVHWSPPSVSLSAVTVMFHLRPCKNIWATIVCFSSSYNLKLYRSVLLLSLFGLGLCSAVVFLCEICHPALAPHRVSLGLYLSQHPLSWRGDSWAQHPQQGCAVIVWVVLLWTWNPHKCSGFVDSYLVWFDHLCSPGGGLSSDGISSVWPVLDHRLQMLQPRMFFRLFTSMTPPRFKVKPHSSYLYIYWTLYFNATNQLLMNLVFPATQIRLSWTSATSYFYHPNNSFISILIIFSPIVFYFSLIANSIKHWYVRRIELEIHLSNGCVRYVSSATKLFWICQYWGH